MPPPHRDNPLNERQLQCCLPRDWQSPAAFVVCLDATGVGRPFPDMATQARHIGTHEVAVRTLVRDEGTDEDAWLRRAVREIAQAVAGPARGRAEAHDSQHRRGRAVAAPLVTVLVYCAHGKHRSVGLAYLLSAGLQYANLSRVELLHLSQREWTVHGCGNGWTCQACDTSAYSASRDQTLVVLRGIVEEELDEVNLSIMRR